jgi:hypothetical protein
MGYRLQGNGESPRICTLDNAVLLVHPDDESQPTVRLSPVFWRQINEPLGENPQAQGRFSHLVDDSCKSFGSWRNLIWAVAEIDREQWYAA